VDVIDAVRRHARKFLWPALAWAILIFVLSSIPGSAFPELDFEFEGIDKVVHFFLYAGLCSLSFAALRHQWWSEALSKHAWFGSLLFSVVYGALDELHQLLTPERTCDVQDWFADCAGAVFGLGIAFLVLKAIAKWRKFRNAANGISTK
jgi:VanZ family protein